VDGKKLKPGLPAREPRFEALYFGIRNSSGAHTVAGIRGWGLSDVVRILVDKELEIAPVRSLPFQKTS
jgi:hypothetical protein